jgi:hypothetical protein
MKKVKFLAAILLCFSATQAMADGPLPECSPLTCPTAK